MFDRECGWGVFQTTRVILSEVFGAKKRNKPFRLVQNQKAISNFFRRHRQSASGAVTYCDTRLEKLK
jgi:hypothetical protein